MNIISDNLTFWVITYANMTTTEKQQEYALFDMDYHVGSEGNNYDFTFGMNWNE